MIVQDAMSKEIICCNISDNASTAVKLMRTHRIGGLPVLDEHGLCGIITETDLLKLLHADAPTDDLWLPSPFEFIELPIREILNWEKTKKAFEDIGNTPISKIMSHPVITATPDMEIDAAAQLMIHRRINRLVVVDAKGSKNVSGIITRQDIIWSLGGDDTFGSAKLNE